MAKILFAWELGNHLGHITRLEPIASALAGRGHTVYAALRVLSRAKQVFRDSRIKLLQAPFRHPSPTGQILPTLTFAHILHNSCFGDGIAFEGRAAAWRSMMEFVQPDLVICDHSPTALLVSRLFGCQRVYLGSGFACPPNTCPLPKFRPQHDTPIETLVQDEHRVLAVVNQWLSKDGVQPLGRLVDLYTEANDGLLATFPELDHYGQRPGAHYQGIWSSRMGEPPQWPQANGKRVFVYLNQFPHLESILGSLRQWKLPALAYVSNLDRSLRERMNGSTIHFADSPVDLREAAGQCDFAIVHASHGTAARMLLAGKPLLLLPSHLEQRLLAERVIELGAGLIAEMGDAEHIRSQLQNLLLSGEYAKAAETFAAKYADFDSDKQLQNVVRRLEEMVV